MATKTGTADNGDYDLTSAVAVLTDTPDATDPVQCQVVVEVGDGTKDLDGTGVTTLSAYVTVGGVKWGGTQTIETDSGDDQVVLITHPFPVLANTEIKVYLESDNGSDTDVDVTATPVYVSDVNAAYISRDDGAADSLESMLDGTGATLTLDKFKIAANDANGAFEITNSGGPAFYLGPTTYGIHIASGDDAIYLAPAVDGNAITVAVSGAGQMLDGSLVAANFGASSLDGKGDWNTTTPPTAAAIRTEMDSNSTQLAAIVEDTGTTLPATLASILEDTGTTLPATLATIAGYLDTEIAAILEDTSTTIPATLATILEDTATTLPGLIAALNDLSQAEANAACDAALADYDPPTKAEMDAGHGLLATEAKQDIIDGLVDAIKAKTDGLNFAGTDVKATLDGEEVTPADGSITAAKIGADAITNAKIADDAIAAGNLATNAITSDALAASANEEIADAVWDEVLTGATHNIATSAGRRLRELAGPVVHSGTCQAGSTSSTIVLAADASAVDDTYDPSLVTIVNGTGAGQSRMVLQYVGATRTAYVKRDWKITPDDTSEYIIFASAGDTHINEGVAQAGGASTITLNSLASSSDDIYNEQLVFIVAGTGADQARLVTDYTGSTRVATVERPWVTQPDATSVYIMIPFKAHPLSEIRSEAAGALSDANLDHLMKTPVANNADMTTEVPDGTVLSNIMSKTSDTSSYTVADDSLEAISDGAGGGGGGDATAANQTTIIDHLTDIKGSTFDGDTDALEDLRDRIDAAIAGTALTTPAWAGSVDTKKITTYTDTARVLTWDVDDAFTPTGKDISFHLWPKDKNQDAPTYVFTNIGGETDVSVAGQVVSVTITIPSGANDGLYNYALRDETSDDIWAYGTCAIHHVTVRSS